MPVRYSGYEMHHRGMLDIAAEIGRGCGSAAWIFSNIAAQNGIVAMASKEVQDEVWGDDCDESDWSAQELRSIYQHFRALSGARRGIASVLCVMARLANRRGGALRRRRSWSSVEEQGQAGLHRAPGAAEHRPGMDRGCGAQPQVGNDGKRGRTGEDHYETVSLARGRYSILNCHDGEIAAVHAATAVCSPSTRSTPPARLIVETHRAD